MKVPFLDLKAQHKAIAGEIDAALHAVIEQSAFAGGPFVETFEREFAEFCGCRHAIGVGNGTDALWLALLALDIGPDDEVITVPNTFIATVEAISLAGATPVLVDVDPRTYTMDPDAFEAAITSRTRAVIPVHLYGQMADMDPIRAIANAHGVTVIEDACQAHGATYKGRRAGSIGDAGCFSFYPGKNLGAFGEAGAIVTNRADIADKARVFRDHGQRRKYDHAIRGWNARMDGLQAAVLSVKLKRLDQANAARRKAAQEYTLLFDDVEDVTVPYEAGYGEHIYHVYAIRTPRREALMSALQERGIGYGIHYPVPIHLQDAYSDLGLAAGTFPVAEQAAGELLSLPMFPELRPEQIQYVACVVRAQAGAVPATRAAAVLEPSCAR
jgi:dTDP-4-amino-4,6-dideoxygalactose transaminase